MRQNNVQEMRAIFYGFSEVIDVFAYKRLRFSDVTIG